MNTKIIFMQTILSLINFVLIIYITFKIKKMSEKNDAIVAAIQGIGENVENIAADVQRLSAGGNGLTAEEADNILSKLNDLSARTKAVADETPEPEEPTEEGEGEGEL